MMIKNQSRRFSLIELLVVITVLMMIASLLSPSLRKMVSSSRTLKCSNNLRMMGVTNASYSDDEGNLCIPFVNSDELNTKYIYPWTNHPIWEEGLGHKLPGTGSLNKFNAVWPLNAMCPLSEEVESNHRAFRRSLVWSSYGMNYHYTQDSRMKYHGSYAIEVYDLDKVNSPSKSMFMADGVWTSVDRDSSTYELWSEHGSVVKNPWSRIPYRHNEAANIMFFDGHVETRNGLDVYADKKLWYPYGN